MDAACKRTGVRNEVKRCIKARRGLCECKHLRCVPVSQRFYDIELNDKLERIGDGSIVIAAITSCTNTSNPSVLLGAALLARNAVQKGLRVPGYVKTSSKRWKNPTISLYQK